MTKQEQIAAALADVADLPIDDDEAWQNAIFRRHNSNVARAYLRLLSVRPEGVPTEPTPDMCAAGGAVVLDHILFDRGADGELDPHGKARVGMDNAAKVYAAMVKAHSSPLNTNFTGEKK